MKKLTALFLILGLLLAGCGKEPDVAGTVAPLPAQTVPETTQATEPTIPLTLGRMSGGTYTNTYAGFGCTLDEDWTYSSAEELLALPEGTQALLEGSEMGDLLADTESITDMMAENAGLLCNVNVLFQKLDPQTRLAYTLASPEEILDAALEQKDVMISSYAQAGITITKMEKTTVTFLGQPQLALYSEGTVNSLPVYFTQIFDYSRGAYSVTTTFTSYIQDSAQYMMDLFYPLDGSACAASH